MNDVYSIPVYQPLLGDKEKAYVLDCLDTNWISSKGSYINKFEGAFASYVGVKYAATCSNGTVALHLAMLALGIKSGDEVIVPTLTYIASVNAISYVGAKPIFVDSLVDTWQMDPDDIRKKITSKTKAIMVVHLYGYPCNMDAIVSIACEYGLFIIEDCAEAIGSFYNGKHVGIFGDVAAFSFYGNKTITTGEGGMVVTNNEHINNLICRYKGQGLASGREYWHDLIGFNYRMTNICAAIGLAQLAQIDEILQQKRQLAAWYKKLLDHLPVYFQKDSHNSINSYWMVSILVDEIRRDDLRAKLAKNGVETRPLFIPVHSMPAYQSNADFKVAMSLSRRGINLPSWPQLRFEDVCYICSLIELLH